MFVLSHQSVRAAGRLQTLLLLSPVGRGCRDAWLGGCWSIPITLSCAGPREQPCSLATVPVLEGRQKFYEQLVKPF